jgi:hypothetical protein
VRRWRQARGSVDAHAFPSTGYARQEIIMDGTRSSLAPEEKRSILEVSMEPGAITRILLRHGFGPDLSAFPARDHYGQHRS